MSYQEDLRTQITEKIVESLQAGVRPWIRPWQDTTNSGAAANAVSGRNYSGINPLLLGLAARTHACASRWWATFNQIASLGGMVKKRPANVRPGEWGTKIVYFAPVEKATTNSDGSEGKVKYFFLRTYTVFNVDQCEGEALEKYRARPRSGPAIVDYEPAERAIQAVPAGIRYGGNRAFYSRDDDYIQIPLKETFTGVEEWYSTHWHEIAHWSESRLGWEASYAMNELVAEISACYLASELNLPQSEDLSNHTAYLGHWLKELKADHRAIFKASQQASKVANFIRSFSRGEASAEETAEPVAAQEAGA